MAEFPEQKLEVELPTLLMDYQGKSVGAGIPGLAQMGYLAVSGSLEFGIRLDCEQGDPSRVSLSLRVLSAHYSPPADCPPRALETIHHVNRELTERLSGGVIGA